MSSSNNISTRRISEAGISGSGVGVIFQGQGGIYQGHGGIGIFGRCGRGRSGCGYVGRGNHRHSRQDARMVSCNVGSQLEVCPSYDFTNDEWHSLSEEKRIRIIEERVHYKISCTNRYGGYTGSVAMSEITAANTNDVNTVQG